MTYNYRLYYDDLTSKLINLLLEIKIDIKKGKQVDKITTKIINQVFGNKYYMKKILNICDIIKFIFQQSERITTIEIILNEQNLNI